MLERQSLILGPWKWTDADCRCRSRLIFDASDRQFLGRVASRRAIDWLVLRRFSRRIWDVLETEDESLLLSVHCPWGWIKPWEMFDADGSLVCILHQNTLFDSGGKIRAKVRLSEWPRTLPSLRGEEGRVRGFVGADGGVLGWIREINNEAELIFEEVIACDPFAKMALLGSTLAVTAKNCALISGR